MLLKGTARKITSQEGGFLSFLKPLMAVGLPLIKIALTPFAKSILVPFGLTAVVPATDAAFKRNFLDREHQHYYFQMKT